MFTYAMGEKGRRCMYVLYVCSCVHVVSSMHACLTQREETQLSLLIFCNLPSNLNKKNALTNIFSLKMIGRSKRGRGEHVGIPPKTRRKRQEIKFAFVFVMFFMFFVFGLCRYHKKRHPPHTQLKPLINYTTPVELMHIFRDRHRRGIRDTGIMVKGQRG